jgi:hypothetical protein
VECVNVSIIVGIVVSRKLATLNELQTVYGTKDLHDFLEIIRINDKNEELARANNH